MVLILLFISNSDMKKIYTLTAIIFMLLITVVGVQTFVKIFPETSLGGVQASLDPFEFSLKNWFSGRFQNRFEKQIERLVGFKGGFVRTNNQLDYFLFHENNMKTEKIIIGKGNWLFQKSDIYGTYQKSVSNDILQREIDALVSLDQIMRKHNKKLIFIAAPNKANIYSEFLPYGFQLYNFNNKTDIMAQFVHALKKTDVTVIDGREFFMELKKTSEYPLFPKGGGHWSVFGASKILEKIYNIAYPEYKISIIMTNEAPHYMDNDLIDLINVWTPDLFRDRELA